MTEPSSEKKKIVIVGLPNTGKSQVFNNLTGEYTLVGNYPFTTVENKKGQVNINGQRYEIFDTPGLHCLYIHSEEELQVRNMIFEQKPDVVIQCIDANRLKQSFTLTSDLLELGIPLVVSLNAIDETTKKGMWIDSKKLSSLLGVEVVESVATTGIGTDKLKEAVARARKGRVSVQYSDIIEEGISRIVGHLPEEIYHSRKLSVLMLLNDPFIMDFLKKQYGDQVVGLLKQDVKAIRSQFRGNLNRFLNNKRNTWIDDICEKVTKKQRIDLGAFSQTFARLSRHPIFGIPILLAIIFGIYQLVVGVANSIAGWMNQVMWLPIESSIDKLIPPGLANEFLIGDYGVLTFGLSNAILTVVPILFVFFMAFNILEDIGYIPNLCVLTKRIFEKVGLSGSAIMPLVLGFGCKTMATLTTKSLRSRKERYIAIYLVAFAIPCAAQMALNMSILGRIGVRAFVIAFSVLAFVEIAAGVTLNKLLKEEDKGDFIQELPAIRLPDPKAVLKKTYYRIAWFLKEALPVFIFAAMGLFLAEKLGILTALKHLIKPLMESFLGLPVEMVDALILCMAKHEAAAALIIKMIERGQLNYAQCIISVTLTTMFVPCVANIVAMIKELGAKSAVVMILIINISAMLFAGALNFVMVGIFKM